MFNPTKSNPHIKIGSIIVSTGIILLAVGLIIMLYYEEETIGIVLMIIGIFDALTGWFITNRHHNHQPPPEDNFRKFNSR